MFLKRKFGKRKNIKELENGEIIVEDGYAIMTQDTLAYLVAMVGEGSDLIN